MTEPAAPAARRTRMRPRLGLLAPLVAPVAALAAVATLTGCGSSSSSTAAQDPGASTSPSSGPVSPPGAQVHLISQTGAGGKPTATATPLNTPDQIAAFAQQFRMPAMAGRIRAVTAKAGSGDDVEGAVIMVGCDRPPGAAVQVDGDTVTITPYDVESPLQECLAAVTTVAIAVIPQG
jgi:hypothetical protein